MFVVSNVRLSSHDEGTYGAQRQSCQSGPGLRDRISHVSFSAGMKKKNFGQERGTRMGMDSFYVCRWAAGIRQADRKHDPRQNASKV